MFARSQAMRTSLLQTARRRFQTHGTSETGFDRMILDKLNWSKGAFNGGTLFALLGIGNVCGYLLSHVMEKKNFEYWFLFKNDGRMFTGLRTMLASENLLDVAWTSPSLILGGLYLQKQMGVMKSTQFFWLALGASMMFTSAFGPNTWIGKNLHCRDYLPFHMFTMCRKDGSG